jgi:hypothetical protein
MQPLASADQTRSQSNTNLSTTVSLSIHDQYGNDIPIQTNLQQSIAFIIPRDINLVVPSMFLQNVLLINITSPHQQLFNLYYVNITQSNNLSISIHFEMHPLDITLAYLLIYKFDSSPQLNSSINQTDGWSLFCSSSKLALIFVNEIFQMIFESRINQ